MNAHRACASACRLSAICRLPRPRLALLVSLPAALLLSAALPPAAADAGDWPQILGPSRNGEAVGETLKPWGGGGPPTLWQRKLGAGFSGAAVAGRRVVVFHRVADEERIEALDLDSGKPLWSAAFAANYRGGINPDRGPRCVPLIAGERVYCFGAAGDLHCVALADGAKRWSRSLGKEYRALEGYFGAGSTPILADGVLVINVGGRDDAGIVGLNPENGRTVWKGGRDNASYSSPAAYQQDGEPRVVLVTRLHCVGLAPRTGEEQFRFPFGKTGPTVNAATPLVFDNRLFLTASYGVGAKLVALETGRELWGNDESMSSQYTTCVHRGGMLYGSHGREDVGDASLRCVDAANGTVRWEAREIGAGHLILAGDHLLIQEVEGRLTLAAASPEKFTVLARHDLKGGTWRALPALSGGRLLLRSTGTGDQASELRCLDLR